MLENQANLQEMFLKDEVLWKVAELIIINDQVSPSEYLLFVASVH